MKDLNLPEPIAAYFQADRETPAAVARCFTPHGFVRDEGDTYTGASAIEGWKADAAARYDYTTTPHALEMQDRSYIVTSRVAGTFPGSPVDLRYAFTLERGKIASLEIGV